MGKEGAGDTGNTKVVISVLGAIAIFTAGIFLGQFLSTGAILGKAGTGGSPGASPAVVPDQPAQPAPPVGKPIEEDNTVPFSTLLLLA